MTTQSDILDGTVYADKELHDPIPELDPDICEHGNHVDNPCGECFADKVDRVHDEYKDNQMTKHL